MKIVPTHLAGVLGFGGPELIVILVILLVLFGGARLPELAKGLGKSIKEFKRASAETDDSAREPVASEPRATEGTPDKVR